MDQEGGEREVESRRKRCEEEEEEEEERKAGRSLRRSQRVWRMEYWRVAALVAEMEAWRRGVRVGGWGSWVWAAGVPAAGDCGCCCGSCGSCSSNAFR